MGGGGKIRKSKNEIILELDGLDKLAGQQILTGPKRDRRKELGFKLERLWKIEEIKVRQISRDRDVLEGDKNTAYFFVKSQPKEKEE
jgi:hypothetical protein